MTDTTHDSFFSQSPPDNNGNPPMMGYSALTTHAEKQAFECRVAQRILAWVASSPDFPYYRDYLQLVTEDTLNSEYMRRLGFGLWRHLDASMWLTWRDANGSSSLLWQYAILYASRYLKTGRFY